MKSTEPPTIGMKLCKCCGEVKHVLAFSSDRKMADGLANDCRACVGDRNAKRYYRRKAECRLGTNYSLPIDGMRDP